MKTICIYNKDTLDGLVSAAIVRYKFRDIQTSEPMIDFIGYHYGDIVPELHHYDKVILVGTSFPKKDMLELINDIDTHFIWIDNHKSAIDDSFEFIHCGTTGCNYGIQDIKFDSCELTWKYFFPDKDILPRFRLNNAELNKFIGL